MTTGNASLLNLKDMTKDSTDTAETTSTAMFVELSTILPSDTFRCREQENDKRVKEYAEVFIEHQTAVDNGDNPEYPFPPIRFWQDEKGKYHLVTGFHRYAAAKAAGRNYILAEEFHGTKEEGIMFAMRDNHHGLRMSYGDLRYAIAKVLRLFPNKTAGAIAKESGFKRSYVYRIEKELSTSGQLTKSDKRKGTEGKEYSSKRRKRQPPELSKGLEEKVGNTLRHFTVLADKFPAKPDSTFIYDTLIKWAKEEKKKLKSRQVAKKATEKPLKKSVKKGAKKTTRKTKKKK